MIHDIVIRRSSQKTPKGHRGNDVSIHQGEAPPAKLARTSESMVHGSPANGTNTVIESIVIPEETPDTDDDENFQVCYSFRPVLS